MNGRSAPAQTTKEDGVPLSQPPLDDSHTPLDLDSPNRTLRQMHHVSLAASSSRSPPLDLDSVAVFECLHQPHDVLGHPSAGLGEGIRSHLIGGENHVGNRFWLHTREKEGLEGNSGNSVPFRLPVLPL